MSVTFQDEKVNSKATSEYGWRVTPYAYLLLKARGPKIDKVPPLRLDLDFMDTSGYVVLPVESPTIPVDASPAKGSVRPFEKLQLTQTLDERQAAQGKLIVEIKAAARGLVPDLDQLVSLDQPGFEREKIDDQGVSVTKFDQESPATVINSERTWLVTYHAAPGQAKPPGMFRFASAKIDDAEQVFQRYVDADLAKVGAEVPLEERYERRATRGSGGSAAGCLRWVLRSSRSGSSGPDQSEPLPPGSRCRTSSPPSRCWACFAISSTTTVYPPPPCKSSRARLIRSNSTTSPSQTASPST